MAVDSDPKNQELLAENREQLKKIPGPSIYRKKAKGRDSESIYTESDSEIDEDEDVTTISRTLGVLGVQIRNQNAFMTSMRRMIDSKSDSKQQRIKDSIEILNNFYEAALSVKIINTSAARMSSKYNNSHSKFSSTSKFLSFDSF